MSRRTARGPSCSRRSGAVTARLFGLDRITFFENGIVSLNLPPLAQVVGARATRTTHPQVLGRFPSRAVRARSASASMSPIHSGG